MVRTCESSRAACTIEMLPIGPALHQLRVKTAARVDHRRQDRHGMRIRREALEVVLHVFVQILVLGEQIGELPQLGAVGQLPMNEKISRFDEGGVLGEFFDGNAPVTENALFAVDEGNRAGAGTVFA